MSAQSATDRREHSNLPIIHVKQLDLHPTGTGIKGIAAISYEATTVLGIYIIDQPGHRPRIRPPHQTIEANGQRQSIPIVHWQKPFLEAVNRAVINAYARATGDGDLFDDEGDA